MKNNYFTIDPSISASENMKKLVNPIFQREISFDVLRGKPPVYSSLYINGIHFTFLPYLYSFYSPEESKSIKYLQLTFSLHKNKYNHKRKSIKIIDQKINMKYLRKIFDTFKELKETNESVYLTQQNKMREMSERLEEIRERNKIKYPEMSLYEGGNNGFNLSFNSVNEDEIDQLISYWNKIKK